MIPVRFLNAAGLMLHSSYTFFMLFISFMSSYFPLFLMGPRPCFSSLIRHAGTGRLFLYGHHLRVFQQICSKDLPGDQFYFLMVRCRHCGDRYFPL